MKKILLMILITIITPLFSQDATEEETLSFINRKLNHKQVFLGLNKGVINGYTIKFVSAEQRKEKRGGYLLTKSISKNGITENKEFLFTPFGDPENIKVVKAQLGTGDLVAGLEIVAIKFYDSDASFDGYQFLILNNDDYELALRLCNAFKHLYKCRGVIIKDKF